MRRDRLVSDDVIEKVRAVAEAEMIEAARGVVEGFIAGLHRSPYHGFSVEFSEYRKYVAGDDLRIIVINFESVAAAIRRPPLPPPRSSRPFT